MAQIDWNEISAARNVAEQLKNHYRFADQLTTLVGVIDRAKYLMEEADKQRLAHEGAAREAREKLEKYTADADAARAAADKEQARLKDMMSKAQTDHSSRLAELSAEVEKVRGGLKAAQIQHSTWQEQAKAEAASLRERLTAEHNAHIKTIQKDTDVAVERKRQAERDLTDIQQKLARVAAGLGR